MDIIGQGLIAIAEAIGICARATASVYIVGLITKTALLVLSEDAQPQDFNNWFDFKFWNNKNKNGL